MCKGILKLYSKNFIFIHSTKQEKHFILYSGEHFLFNNIQGCERGTAYTDAVLRDILNILGGNLCQILTWYTKSFDERLKQPKQRMHWQAEMQKFFQGCGGGWGSMFYFNLFQGECGLADRE